MPLWTTRRLIALFAVTFISRALLAAWLGVTGQPRWWEYDVIAANIVSGLGHVFDRLGFVYTAYAPPIWSYLLATLPNVPGEGRVSIQLLQAAFCFGSAILSGLIAQRMTGDETGSVLAGFLVALQPSLAYYSVVNSDPLPLNALLLSGALLAGMTLVENPSSRNAVAMGLLLAACVLSRGTPIVLLPVVTVALVARHGLRPSLPKLAVVVLLLLGAVAPWLARNYVVMGKAVITSTTGENFWRGNHVGASGGVLDLDGGDITHLTPDNEALPDPIRTVLRNGSEADREDIFMNEALRFIVERPGEAGVLFLGKLTTFWWRIESSEKDYSAIASIAYEAVYRVELGLALIGLVALAQKPRHPSERLWVAAVVAASAVGISLLQSAFYVQGRHRFLIEPLLLMFTATGSIWLLRRSGLIPRSA